MSDQPENGNDKRDGKVIANSAELVKHLYNLEDGSIEQRLRLLQSLQNFIWPKDKIRIASSKDKANAPPSTPHSLKQLRTSDPLIARNLKAQRQPKTARGPEENKEKERCT